MLHSVVKSYSNSHRKDLRLYMSFDEGATWEEAFQLQPGWAAYSSMQVLDNGDLAILFEDGSIGNEDANDVFDINYVTISKELIEAKMEELRPAGAVDVKIVYGTTGYETYGTLSGDTWTSNASSGFAGLTLTKSAGDFDKFSNWCDHNNLAYRPAESNTDATLTLTAPDGYVITAYRLKVAKAYSAAHTYTITTEYGTTVSPAFSSYSEIVETGLSTSSTTITVNSTVAEKYLAIADFVVTIVPEPPGPADVKIIYENNAETTYGSWDSSNKVTWTSNKASGKAGLTLTKSGGTFGNYNSVTGYTDLYYYLSSGTQTLTLTAPTGYVITGYSAKLRQGQNRTPSYTVVTADGQSFSPSFAGDIAGFTDMAVSGLSSNSTTITVSNTDNGCVLCFVNWVVHLLKPQRGDVNLDGQVTIADVTALVNIILGKDTSGYGEADINGDGSVTIADVTALVNIILGK